MKKILGIVIIVVFVGIICGLFLISPNITKIDSSWNEFRFDVKLLRFNTVLDVYKSNDYIGTVKGKVVRIITDPLTFYGTNGEKIAYADDTYHLIAQDSHLIINDGVVTAEMVGKVKLMGEAYDIYDNNKNKIATASFDFLNLNGEIKDNEGNAIAFYRAHPFLKDFTVDVSPQSQIDDTTLIMIFASYYSDQAADSESSSYDDDD